MHSRLHRSKKTICSFVATVLVTRKVFQRESRCNAKWESKGTSLGPSRCSRRFRLGKIFRMRKAYFLHWTNFTHHRLVGQVSKYAGMSTDLCYNFPAL
jgi:hypothetical protein